MRIEGLQSQRGPVWTVGLVLVLGLAVVLTAVAARQVTVQLRGESVPAETGEAAGSTDAADSDEANADAIPVPPEVESGALPPEAADLEPGTWSEPIFGDPIVERVDREPFTDLVSVQAGPIPDQMAPPPETTPPRRRRRPPAELTTTVACLMPRTWAATSRPRQRPSRPRRTPRAAVRSMLMSAATSEARSSGRSASP